MESFIYLKSHYIDSDIGEPCSPRGESRSPYLNVTIFNMKITICATYKPKMEFRARIKHDRKSR